MTDDGQDASFTIRLPAELLRHAQSMAASRDETLSQVVRRALRAYVKAGPAQLDPARIARMSSDFLVRFYRICYEYQWVIDGSDAPPWNTQRVNRMTARCGLISTAA
jgi:hypothetical protein